MSRMSEKAMREFHRRPWLGALVFFGGAIFFGFACWNTNKNDGYYFCGILAVIGLFYAVFPKQMQGNIMRPYIERNNGTDSKDGDQPKT